MQNRSEPILNKAKEQEKRYNWLGAVEFYKKASGLASEDPLKAAEIRERIGFCYFRAAFQAETNEQFVNRMKQAVNAYEQAAELFGKTEEAEKEAKINDSKAMII